MLAALGGAGVWLAVMAHQIGRRGAPSHDELHSLLLGRLIAQGVPPSFDVGALTFYEGGSWLIGWPVAVALRLGIPDFLATSWAAAGISALGVLGAGLWLGRRSPVAALAFGPLLALCLPDAVHYGYRAWGSLPEALALLPWMALALPVRRLPLLGVGLGAAGIVSYLHGITALALAWAWRRRPRELAVVAGSAALTFAVWASWIVPGDALQVRGGRSLLSLLPEAARLDRVLLALPDGWLAGRLPDSPLRSGAALALSALAVAALARRSAAASDTPAQGSAPADSPTPGPTPPGPPPHAALRPWAVAGLFATAAATALVPPDQAHRYLLPLLAVGIAAIAAWRPRAILAAAALGLLLRGATPQAMPHPDRVHEFVALGANGLLRDRGEPHRAWRALWRAARGAEQQWMAFGYGVDLGRRLGPTVTGMRATPGADPSRPEFQLLSPLAWIDFYRGRPDDAPDRLRFLQGLGVGLAADGIQPIDEELLALTTTRERDAILAGVAATVAPTEDRELRALLAAPLVPTPRPR